MLVAMLDDQHVHHAAARRWWDTHADQGWASCPLTENGAVRVMSSTPYFRRLGKSAADVISLLAELVARTNHEFWPDDVSIRTRDVFPHNALLTSRQITDVYLLGLAAVHGGRLVTFDQGIDIGAVPRATVENLVAL